MPTISYSKLAEIELHEDWLNNNEFVTWLKAHATFNHNHAYEFIHHLHPVETEEWFRINCLIEAVPRDLRDQILEARRKDCARIIFYC